MGRTDFSRRLLFSIAMMMLAVAAAHPGLAQEPELPTVRGNITAVQPPDGFDVAGYHIITSLGTQFSALGGPKKDARELRRDIAIGTYVQVIGDRNRHARTVEAHQIKVRPPDRTLSGFGVIDRMITAGPQPVFRADGYIVRLGIDAQVEFSGGLTTMDEVAPGTWVRYEGNRNSSGELIATSAKFIQPKPRKPKTGPAKTAQVTEFPPGSMIDFDGSFSTKQAQKKPEDTPGGECGWYPVPDVPAVQEHVRRIGMRLIPQYQRDLPAHSPAKIPFRFYVVEEKSIRADMSCYEGLVLIPVNVINRLRNEDQLAAVVADGVAASLQRQHARVAVDLGITGAVEMAAYLALNAAGGAGAAAYVGGAVVKHEIARKMEEQRGRVAVSLLADAGYDPWQAPEAWRLLDPKDLPKDMTKLKYPRRAGYQLEILNLQYKPGSTSTAAQSGGTAADPN